MADNTIALQAKAPVIDPLATITSLNQAQQGLLQNRLLGQDVAGRSALNRAINSSRDPVTGAPNYTAAASDLSGDAEAAFMAPELSAKAVAQHLAETKASDADLELGLKQSKVLQSAFGPLLKLSDKELNKNLLAQVMRERAISTGLFHDPASMKLFSETLNSIPDDAPGSVIRAVIERGGEAANFTVEGINLYRGTPTTIDTGPAVNVVRTGGLAEGLTPVASMQKGLTPGEKTDTVTTYGTDEKPYAVPKGQIYDAYGNLQEGAAASGGGAGGNGRYPGAPRGAIGPTANAPGVEDSAIRDSATFHATADRVANFAADEQAIRGAINALEGAKTGKGGQPIQDWRSLLLTMGAKLGKEDEQAAVDYAKAGKYLAAIAKQAGTDAAMNTDAARALVQEANPSLETVNRAAREMLPIILGQRRMDAALVAAADAAGINSRNPRGISDFKAKWGRDNDPAAFSADLIPAAERRKYIDALKTDAAKARYVAGLRAAIDAGMFTRADLAK